MQFLEMLETSVGLVDCLFKVDRLQIATDVFPLECDRAFISL
jgi:hypothetical protein